MYYNKKDLSYWKGPGTVIEYDNVFVRHGGTYIRISPCKLQLINKVEDLSAQMIIRNAVT